MLKLFVRTWILATLLLSAALGAGEDAAVPIVIGNNALSHKLLGELGKVDGNLFFSPYSIHAALTMTYAGARGQTATEMGQVLGLFDETTVIPDPTPFAAGHGALAAALAAAGGDQVRLEIANGLFGAKGYPFLPAFLALNQQHFGAGLKLCDFAGQADAERQGINTWVADKTEQKIVDLLPPGSIEMLTRLVLVNAIYFKANWAAQFDQKLTTEETFYPTAEHGAKVAPLGRVPLMHRQAKMAYCDTALLPIHTDPPVPRAQVVILPYVGDQVEFILVLPQTGAPTDLAACERGLSQLLQHLRPVEHQVDLYLPRFEMRWGTESIADALKRLGMPTAFSDQADFTAMSATGELFIVDVFHQAYVKLDEEGTEAAAATAVIMQGRAAHIESEPVAVRADHPFLFVIRHTGTGTVLFVGRVANPCQ